MCSSVFKLEEGENYTSDAFKVIFLIQMITAYKSVENKTFDIFQVSCIL